MGVKGRSIAPIGYLIELNGVTEHPEHAASIDCPDCRSVEDALTYLVHDIAPGEVTHVARGAVQLGSAHDGRPEVSATVSVIHRGGHANRPPGDDERARLSAIVDRLRALGAQEKHWRDREQAGT
jgi:hypothetical protein